MAKLVPTVSEFPHRKSLWPQQSATRICRHVSPTICCTEKYEPKTPRIVSKTNNVTTEQVCNLDTIAAALVGY
jgi:hypothetical protein